MRSHPTRLSAVSLRLSPARKSFLPLLVPALVGALVATLPTRAGRPAADSRPGDRGFGALPPADHLQPDRQTWHHLFPEHHHAYGGTGDYGIIRNCTIRDAQRAQGGRAWDWKASASNATQVRQVGDMLAWLFATDRYGNNFAQARRLGIMYVIWNHRIWVADSPLAGTTAGPTRTPVTCTSACPGPAR